MTENDEGFLYAGYLIRLRPKIDYILPDYLYFHLCEPMTRLYIEDQAKSTSGVNNINSEEICSINLKIPDLQEQQKIVEKIRAYFLTIENVQQEIEKVLNLLVNFEQATLSKAFRGELVPQDPNDEPASVLLERIRATRAQMADSPRGRRQGKQAELDF